MSEPKSYRNFIDGEWVESSGKKTFEDRSPADRSEIIGTFQDSAQADVDQAVEAARRSFRRWRQVPAPKRAESLFRMGEILLKRKEEYAREMTRDMGKPIKEARGDVQEAIDVCYHVAGEGRRMFGFTTPSELPNKSCSAHRMPVGVCALITPWNFPMAIPSWKLIPALLCGNSVVIKPASDAPLSCYYLVKVCQEVGIPRGVVNYVTGGGEGVGMPLTRHDGVALVSFTGSSETGRQVNLACADTFKRVSLEMGGKNAMIVMDDARLDLAVDGALWGAFATAGQRCTATSRIIVHKKVHKEFVDRLVERASALKVGDGLDESVDVGPMINESQLKKAMDYVQVGRDEGADPILGGVRLTKNEYGRGFFFPPTIFTGVKPAMRIAREEIFGPIVCVLAADGLDDALEIANDSLYGLSSSIYTQDVNRAFVAARELETGIAYVNSSTIGAETHLPFGGTRRTGNGHREGAAHTAIDIFSEWKTVYVDYSGKLQKAQIDNN
ncbi:MAG TPA: aldehyde dehydrogenase family protein [Candidatus Polarisedimenticolia bacterium]|nr:aldehyde dehydrogenase family protein [Candidatus Polarisedimenticolia bacterium]